MKRLVNKVIDDQSGITLMIVMLILFLLTMLGMAMYFMSSTDIKISRNVYIGTRAFFAAESGINEGIARLNLSSADPNHISGNAPPYDTTEKREWSTIFNGTMNDGDKYEVTISHKIDTKDLNGNGDTDEVVTYDKTFFNDPGTFIPSAGTGYAVEVIRSTGHSSDGEATIVLEITKWPMNLRVKGAVTANSQVNVTGNINIDGYDHSMDYPFTQLPVDPSGFYPAVVTTADNTVSSGGSSTLNGQPPYVDKTTGGSWDPSNPTWGAFPNSPGEALGLSTSDATDFFANSNYNGPYDGSIGMSSPLSGVNIITGDYPGPKDGGSGILIIHNPNYDPCKYEAKKNNDTTSPCWDASYDYTAPANQPAVLGNYNSNATFKGLIIADVVDKIAGTPTIVGAIISLSTIDVQHYGTGNADILYSSEALNSAASLGFSKKLAWYKE